MTERIRFVAAALLAAAALGASGLVAAAEMPPGHGTGPPVSRPPEVAAVVDGIIIRGAEIEAYVSRRIPRISFHGRIPESKRDALRREAFDKLVIEILAAREGKSRGLDVSDKLDKELDKVRQRLKAKFGEKIRFDEVLANAGHTLESYSEVLARKPLAEMVRRSDVIDKVEVSDDGVKAFYEANKGLFVRPEAVKFKHMLLKVRPLESKEELAKIKRLADQARVRLARGSSFKRIAKRYTGSVPKGAEAGESPVHRGSLMKEVEKAVFALKPGETSAVVRSMYGFHIVQLVEKIEARQMPFDEVRSGARKMAERTQLGELTRAWEEGLRKDVEIEIRWSRLQLPRKKEADPEPESKGSDAKPM